jgi:hypothetical protein
MPMTVFRRNNPGINYGDSSEYRRVRLENAKAFELQLSMKAKNPFYKLHNYLLRKRDI